MNSNVNDISVPTNEQQMTPTKINNTKVCKNHSIKRRKPQRLYVQQVVII